jgi:hypothetical protein
MPGTLQLEKDAVADLHLVAHEVARLNGTPYLQRFARAGEIVDADIAGLTSQYRMVFPAK